jgi:hypothetical protein
MRHQHVALAADEFIPVVVSQFILVAEEYRLLGTGFLAEPAKDTSDQVYFVHLGVSLALFVFRRFHIDGVGWTGSSAQAAANASFRAVFVAFQIMQTSVPGRHIIFDARVLFRHRFFKQVSYRGVKSDR